MYSNLILSSVGVTLGEELRPVQPGREGPVYDFNVSYLSL